MGFFPDDSAPSSVGRYTLHGRIAAGGMATVHFGLLHGPMGFTRTVAIKRMHSHFRADPDFVSMFLDEARTVARIRHPNVVSTIDVVMTETDLFLVMEYVQGETVARLLRTDSVVRGGIPLPVVANVFSGVLRGLHAAHEAKNERGEPLGIVHRDISPQNVIVGVDGVARLLDFGVAKARGRIQTTSAGQLKGKLSYMSPEQLTGAKVHRQTDVYGASVLLWETLTGTRLFDGETDAAILNKIVAMKIEAPSALAPRVPAALDAIVLRGLERDPKNRFATASQMATALEEALPLAIPAAVTAWIESVATDTLGKQATRVAQIECGAPAAEGVDVLPPEDSDSTVLAPAPDVTSVHVPSDMPSSGGSQMSSFSVVGPAAAAQAPARPNKILRGAIVVLALAAGAGVSVLIGGAGRRESGATERASAAGSLPGLPSAPSPSSTENAHVAMAKPPTTGTPLEAELDGGTRSPKRPHVGSSVRTPAAAPAPTQDSTAGR